MVATGGYTERFLKAMRKAGRNPDSSKDVRVLAGELSITYQAMAKVINGGTKMMAADNNVRAARLLNVSSEWLATGEGTPEPAGSTGITPWALSVATDAQALPPPKRRQLRRILNALMSDEPEPGEEDDPPPIGEAQTPAADPQATAEQALRT